MAEISPTTIRPVLGIIEHDVAGFEAPIEYSDPDEPVAAFQGPLKLPDRYFPGGEFFTPPDDSQNSIPVHGKEIPATRRLIPENDLYAVELRKQATSYYRSVDTVFMKNELRNYNRARMIRIGAFVDKARYQDKKLRSKDTTQPDEVVGRILETNDRVAAVAEYNAALAIRQGFRTLANDVYAIVSKPYPASQKNDVLAMLHEMFSAKEAKAEMKQFFGKDLAGLTSLGLLQRIADGSFSTAALIAVAHTHNSRMALREQQLVGYAETVKTEFRQAIEAAVTRGEIPDAARRNLHRLDSTQVRIMDVLLSRSPNIYGMNYPFGGIFITSTIVDQGKISKLRESLFHEMLHEISGKSLTVAATHAGRPAQAYYEKDGMRTIQNGRSYAEYRWINEAYTEMTALRLSGHYETSAESHNGSDVYTHERQTLERLYASDVNDRLVANAYFEDVSTAVAPAERGIHTTALIRQINAAAGHRTWDRLENADKMRAVSHYVLDRSFVPGDYLSSYGTESGVSGMHCWRVHIRLGEDANSLIANTFTYIGVPRTVGGQELSSEDHQSNFNQTLHTIRQVYGDKVTFRVEDNTQPARSPRKQLLWPVVAAIPS